MTEIQRFLSENQQTFTEELSEIVLETLHGDMGIDYWNNAKWVSFFLR